MGNFERYPVEKSAIAMSYGSPYRINEDFPRNLSALRADPVNYLANLGRGWYDAVTDLPDMIRRHGWERDAAVDPYTVPDYVPSNYTTQYANALLQQRNEGRNALANLQMKEDRRALAKYPGGEGYGVGNALSYAVDPVGDMVGGPLGAMAAKGLSALPWEHFAMALPYFKAGFSKEKLPLSEYVEEMSRIPDYPDNLSPGEKLWLRYGQPPESGRSKHLQHGYEEDGVSTMAPLDELGRSTWSPNMINTMMIGDIDKQNLYVVSGKMIGRGSDGEPLIAGAKIVRRAHPIERNKLVSDMEGVALKHFGFSKIDGLHRLLDSEIPDYEKSYLEYLKNQE